MEERKWFLLVQNEVKGPFDKTTLEIELAQNSAALVWGRGQNEWMNWERWKKHLIEMEQNQHKAKAPDRLWRLRVGQSDFPPLTYQKLIQELKKLESFQDVWIWTEGYSEWRDVFQIHKVMDDLGVGRRAHPRVPIAGQVMCEGATGNFVGRALSVSEGGLGMTETPAIKIGEKFKVVLKSPNLYVPIHATAEVVFVGQDGYAGLKFIGIQTESKSAIIEYVKKFLDTKADYGAV